MITESLSHCRGVGPVRLAKLHAAGIRSWEDVLKCQQSIPPGIRDGVVAEAQRSLAALDQNDIGYFVDRLSPPDRWTILSRYLDQTSFFDIETSGLEIDSTITVIACWHRGELHTFVEHENLDDFLDLLDDIALLASFNGASFDVPRVLDAFHIPKLPCPHLDLRWSCYHAGLVGGLKDITRSLDIARPADLDGADGDLAVQLWFDWIDNADKDAREHLIRYCAADVLLLIFLAEHLSGVKRSDPAQVWSVLPGSTLPGSTLIVPGASAPQESEEIDRQSLVDNLFGSASPSKLRTRRRMAS